MSHHFAIIVQECNCFGDLIHSHCNILLPAAPNIKRLSDSVKFLSGINTHTSNYDGCQSLARLFRHFFQCSIFLDLDMTCNDELKYLDLCHIIFFTTPKSYFPSMICSRLLTLFLAEKERWEIEWSLPGVLVNIKGFQHIVQRLDRFSHQVYDSFAFLLNFMCEFESQDIGMPHLYQDQILE